MQDEDAFLGGMTVGEYFALPEAERERIWNELYAEAIASAQEREVNCPIATLRCQSCGILKNGFPERTGLNT